MSSYVVSLPPVVSPGNYVIGDGGILVRVKEDDDGGGDERVVRSSRQLLACGYCMATFTAKEALLRHAVSCKVAKKSKKKKNMQIKGSETSVRVVCASSSSASSDEKQEQTSANITCPRKGCEHKFAASELEIHLSCHDAGAGNTFACPKCGVGRQFNTRSFL